MLFETEKPAPADPLQQGDIIRIDAELSNKGAPSLGVIINADCDLAHGKTDGAIAYLPVYPFAAYLELFWAPSFVKEQRQSLLSRIRLLCGIDDEKRDTELIDWIRTTTAEEVATRLGKTCSLKNKETNELTEKLVRLQFCVDQNNSAYVAFASLCRRENSPSEFAKKRIAQAQTSMGDGHFFLSEIAGEPDIGYVVRMRRIFTIDASACFNTTSAQLASTSYEPSAVRIARLCPHLRFKIAQLFAYQYCRIGLPDELAALSALAVDDAVNKLLADAR